MKHRLRAAGALAAACCLFAFAACSAGEAAPARGSRPARADTTAASRESGWTTAAQTAVKASAQTVPTGPDAATQQSAATHPRVTTETSGPQKTAAGARPAASGAAGMQSSAVSTSASEPTAAATAATRVTTATTTAALAWRPLNHAVMKACWLSQYDLVRVMRVSGGGRYAQRPQADFTAKACAILQNLADMGFNTVIIQVRPFGDSFYPSDYYPWSDYVTGTMGKTPDYDPFAILVEEAHRRGLSVHAWINPIRGMKEELIASVPARYKLRQWYDDPAARGDKILVAGGLWYLNPAHGDVRALIAAGAAEVVRKYHVDGLHMDDRFYPTTAASFDAAAYTRYREGGGTLSLKDFRLDCFNRVVRGVYDAVKKENPLVLYGVSPDANISRDYSVHYADVRTWCAKPGYIDYICPQIYYGMEHQGHPFTAAAREWSALIQTPGVRLVAGMTLGKTISEYDQWAGAGAYEWRDHKDVLARCVRSLSGVGHLWGISLFSYQYLFDPVSGAANSKTAREVENLLPALRGLSPACSPERATDS